MTTQTKNMRYFFLFCFLPNLLWSQNAVTPSMDFQLTALNDPVPFAQTITKEDMKKILTVLAADDMEGRETGTPGNTKAANYIAEQLRQIGIPPLKKLDGYFQPIAFTSEIWEDISLSVANKPYRHLWDYYAFPKLNTNRPDLAKLGEVVFLGYGIESDNYNDYKGKDVRGKTILIYDGEPMRGKTSYITNSEEVSDWTTDRTKKLMAAHKNGVKTVLIIDGKLKKNLGELRRELLDGRMKMGDTENTAEKYANHLYISTEIAKDIIGKKNKKFVKARKKIAKKGKPKSVALPTDIALKQNKKINQLLGNNILGFIEGTDPVLKKEIVVVSAHYDHVGMRGNAVYNGADDNGSGSTGILEIAQAFQEAKKQGVGPRRSVLMIWMTGEEKGLLGSEYYSEFPIFPLENTIANINVDMIGRVHSKYKDNPNYIYVIGADRLSTELHKINEAANDTYTNLVLDYTYNDKNDPNRFYYRSDHYNFAKKGIPAVFYFNGTHADYHRVSDTIEKINFDKMEKIGRLIFHTAWELANREKRIMVDVVE